MVKYKTPINESIKCGIMLSMFWLIEIIIGYNFDNIFVLYVIPVIGMFVGGSMLAKYSFKQVLFIWVISGPVALVSGAILLSGYYFIEYHLNPSNSYTEVSNGEGILLAGLTFYCIFINSFIILVASILRKIKGK